jgi:hypothetical protein
MFEFRVALALASSALHLSFRCGESDMESDVFSVDVEGGGVDEAASSGVSR